MPKIILNEIEYGGGGGSGGANCLPVLVLSRAEYDALPVKDSGTIYIIKG